MNSFKRVHAFQIELEFGSVGFLRRAENWITQRKTSWEHWRELTTKYVWRRPLGFEPWPHWREADALTTACTTLATHEVLL